MCCSRIYTRRRPVDVRRPVSFFPLPTLSPYFLTPLDGPPTHGDILHPHSNALFYRVAVSGPMTIITETVGSSHRRAVPGGRQFVVNKSSREPGPISRQSPVACQLPVASPTLSADREGRQRSATFPGCTSAPQESSLGDGRMRKHIK